MNTNERLIFVYGVLLGLVTMLPPLLISLYEKKEAIETTDKMGQQVRRTTTTYLNFQPSETLCEKANIQTVFRSGIEGGDISLYLTRDSLPDLYLGTLLTDTLDVKVFTQNCK